MIVRIQGEGQWELSGSQIDRLDKFDDEIVQVVGDHNHERFHALLAAMLGYVRDEGRHLPDDEIAESDLILPPSDSTMDEVRDLFQGEGLINA
jgi:hypothetical protein